MDDTESRDTIGLALPSGTFYLFDGPTTGTIVDDVAGEVGYGGAERRLAVAGVSVSDYDELSVTEGTRCSLPERRGLGCRRGGRFSPEAHACMLAALGKASEPPFTR